MATDSTYEALVERARAELKAYQELPADLRAALELPVAPVTALDRWQRAAMALAAFIVRAEGG
jgi:hypothetical protein